jgi:hypothetical protein
VVDHRTTAELLAALEDVKASPPDTGVLELIVRRPGDGERDVLEVGELTKEDGLVGDDWLARGSRQSPDGSAELPRQLTIMNSRAAAMFAGDRSRWPIAGDQLYIDLDISESNLPPGTRVRIGATVVEVSVEPHTGCHKFTKRFGLDATAFLRSDEGRPYRLRGLNARVIEPGTIRTGDKVERLAS